MSDPSQEAVGLTLGEMLVEEWRTRATETWREARSPVGPPGASLCFPETQSLADAVDAALRAVERRTLERAAPMACSLCAVPTTAPLVEHPDGGFFHRCNNPEGTLLVCYAATIHAEIASLSLPREGALQALVDDAQALEIYDPDPREGAPPSEEER